MKKASSKQVLSPSMRQKLCIIMFDGPDSNL